MSESGIIDIFFMFGPTPLDIFRQYGLLTGTTNLPPVRVLYYSIDNFIFIIL
jgi:mannosyl-oligosaccharide alpha-1,3-glucosidase